MQSKKLRTALSIFFLIFVFADVADEAICRDFDLGTGGHGTKNAIDANTSPESSADVPAPQSCFCSSIGRSLDCPVQPETLPIEIVAIDQVPQRIPISEAQSIYHPPQILK